jgi:hypothetical protein
MILTVTFDNFNNPDTPINNSISEQFRSGFSPKYKYNKGEFVVNLSLNSIERNYNVFNSYSDAVDNDYKSRNVNVDGLINMRSASSFHSSRNSIPVSGDGIKSLMMLLLLKLPNSTLLILI